MQPQINPPPPISMNDKLTTVFSTGSETKFQPNVLIKSKKHAPPTYSSQKKCNRLPSVVVLVVRQEPTSGRNHEKSQ